MGNTTQQSLWSSVGAPLLLDDGEHSYIYGASSTPLAQVDDSTGLVQYLHADLLGTPRLVTDSAGSQVGTVSFDAFGTVAAQTGVQSAFGFTGNWADPDTGLLYLRARDYDPATGQFLSVDPLVNKTRQPYAYTGNNPVTRVDPTGLCPVNGGSDVADCTPEDFGGASWLLSPEMRALGSNLGYAENSFAGLGDGATFGITEGIRELNGTNCRIEKDGWYWTEYVLGAAGSVITGGAVLSIGLKAIQSARVLFGAAKTLPELVAFADATIPGLTRAAFGRTVWGTGAAGAEASMGRTAAQLAEIPGLSLESATAWRNVYRQAILDGLGIAQASNPTNVARLNLMIDILKTLRG